MTSASPLAGQVALVTGAGRGIGRAIAWAYAEAGAHVVLVARTGSDLDQLAAEVRSAGGNATPLPADVTDEAQVEGVFEHIDRLGALDIAVFNVGGTPSRGSLSECSTSGWQASFELNVTAAFLCARAAVPRLRARGGGKIIVMGSGMGHRGTPDYAAYACAKAAQWMLVRVLAQEVARHNICVNEIVPGPVDTTIGAGRFDPLAIPDEWAKQPADIVPLAMLLAAMPNHGPSAQSFRLLRRDL